MKFVAISEIVLEHMSVNARRYTKGLFRPKTRVFFCCGNSAADISKPHTFKWGPFADEVFNEASNLPTE